MFDTTLFLAIWGAFLSSVAIGWNLYRDLTNIGKININCYIGNIIGAAESSDTDYLVFVVTNIGRQPIMITQVGGGYNSKHFLISPRNIPKMLQPGEYVIEYTSDLTSLKKDLKFLGAWDSYGKIWKVRKKKLKKLIDKKL